MGKLFHNKSIVTIIAIIVCFVILFFAYRYRVNKAINAVNVPIAVKTLQGRDEITESDIKTVKVARSMITNNVILNKSDLVGKFVNYNTFVPEGSMFYKTAVVNWSQMPDSAWSGISNGNTIVSLAVNATSTFGNSIYPGDKIDLYYRNRTGGNDSKYFIGPLIKGIEVLAVKDEDGQHIFKKSAEQQNAIALIFSVPDNLHLLLRKAMYISGGEIIPVPRNSTYKPENDELEGSDYIINFINANSVDIEEDVKNDECNSNNNVLNN